MSDNSFSLGEAVEPAPEAADTAVSADANPSTPTDGEGDPPEERIFKQEDVNKIVAKELAKAERKIRREMEARAAEAQHQSPVLEPPKPADYKSAVDYAEALSEYKYNVRVAHHEQEKQFQGTVSAHLNREEQAREEYDDYDAVAHAEDLPVTREMGMALLESEIGPKILYWLGQNPKEAARIAQMSPLSQAREIGKIETRLSANPPVKKVSNAPEPIKPVGSRSSSPNYDPTDPRSSKLSDEEWFAARERQLRKRAQG